METPNISQTKSAPSSNTKSGQISFDRLKEMEAARKPKAFLIAGKSLFFKRLGLTERDKLKYTFSNDPFYTAPGRKDLAAGPGVFIECFQSWDVKFSDLVHEEDRDGYTQEDLDSPMEPSRENFLAFFLMFNSEFTQDKMLEIVSYIMGIKKKQNT